MQEAINAQINAEMWSAYLYLSMSMEAADNDMKGIAHWFRKQFNEEMEHAMKFVDYLHSQMARVELKAIDAVPTKWDGCPVKMFEQTLEHEKKVTSMIHNLYEWPSKRKTTRPLSCFSGSSTNKWKKKPTPRRSSTR